MKHYTGNIGTNYHYLFYKDYIYKLKQHTKQLYKIISNNISQNDALMFGKYCTQKQKYMLNELYIKIKSQSFVKKTIQQICKEISFRSRQLYQFQTQRNYFLIENFRETCNQPIVSSQPHDCVNITTLFKANFNRELRRVIWVKCLMLQSSKFQFFQYDHKVSPYHLTQQLTIHILKLSLQNQLILKQNQTDCCLRLLDYIIKKWDRIPKRSEQYLAMTIVDVFAYFTPARIQQVGSVFVGLIQLTQTYFEQNVQQRLKLIHLAFQLVDPPTYQLIQASYIPYSQQDQAQLNQCFEHFRLTLTCAFFPIPASQFIIDQLLIKKKNKLDMYILFAMMTMIMSDDLQKYKNDKMQLTDIINAPNTKKVIKVNDVVDAFRVIYQNIHPFHFQFQNQQSPQINKLLINLTNFDQQITHNDQIKITDATRQNQKTISYTNSLKGFVVDNKNSELRMGSKKKTGLFF